MPHEAISVFDMFKVGVGPSSSHTLGPWRAALRFCDHLSNTRGLSGLRSVRVLLYGSLAKTGRGHGTDIALQLGLSGQDPETFDVSSIRGFVDGIAVTRTLRIAGTNPIVFDPVEDIVFLYGESLPYHPNALTFLAAFGDGRQEAVTYYSVGGGFVQTEGEAPGGGDVQLPFPVDKASDLLHWCMKTGLSVSEVVMENESVWRTESETRAGLLRIWRVMRECIHRGCHSEGTLPGA